MKKIEYYINIHHYVIYTKIRDAKVFLLGIPDVTSGRLILLLSLIPGIIFFNIYMFFCEMNNNQLTLVTKRCDFIVESIWTEKFTVGDSISKKEGELFVEHYRDGELIDVLDYGDIAKEMKDDDWDIIWRRLKEKINSTN